MIKTVRVLTWRCARGCRAADRRAWSARHLRKTHPKQNHYQTKHRTVQRRWWQKIELTPHRLFLFCAVDKVVKRSRVDTAIRQR